MISDGRRGYKSWGGLQKQMNDLLCDALKGRISYYHTKYRQAHNAWGRAAINFDGNDLVNFSWVEMCARDSDLFSTHKSYKALETEKWIPEGTLCDEDFINSITAYLDTDVAASLHADNYLLRVFAYMDRRVGKRTLLKIREEAESLPEWVRQFYRIRCEAEEIRFSDQICLDSKNAAEPVAVFTKGNTEEHPGIGQ